MISRSPADRNLRDDKGEEQYMKKAFTLIELLVVVLIIGILSAIALPQYRKAVLKSQMAKYLVALRAFDTAQVEYKLANASYASDVNLLGLSFSDVPPSCINQGTFISCSIYVNEIEDHKIYLLWYGYADKRNWGCYGSTRTNDTLFTSVCQSIQKEWNGTRITTAHSAPRFNAPVVAKMYWGPDLP